MASEIVTIQKDITDIVNSKISMLQNEGLVIAPKLCSSKCFEVSIL
ncbi:hypothetical protein [Streptococcus equi]|nr:hypothetical protein [Streptococcus equi]